MIEFERELAWTRMQMPLLERALATLGDLSKVRLACSMHLDIKMVPLVEGLLDRGARVFLTTCNPRTVRDRVVEHLEDRGATAKAWLGMQGDELSASWRSALEWAPTHLCEMGGDLSVTAHRLGVPDSVRAGMEATGTGVERLSRTRLRYPVYNWDDIAVKEGLHNRYMVGICTWHAFFERSRLTLHGKRVLVVGFGLVGRGLADAARAYGGAVSVTERDPARALEARYAGYHVGGLEELLGQSDVVVTATGVSGLLNDDRLRRLPDGAIVLNSSHVNDEIDVGALRATGSGEEVVPHVERFTLGRKVVYLFAGGAMANLVAGNGDSLNAFQIPLAVMVGAVRHITADGEREPPGLYPLPVSAWESLVS
ncbi:MAG: adenosylhomocysteinase [Spirochaetota bacterium]